MEFIVNDFWQASFSVSQSGIYEYTVEAMIDHLSTWWKDIQKKSTVGNNIIIDIKSGLSILAESMKQIQEPDKKAEIQKVITLIQIGKEQDTLIKKYFN